MFENDPYYNTQGAADGARSQQDDNPRSPPRKRANVQFNDENRPRNGNQMWSAQQMELYRAMQVSFGGVPPGSARPDMGYLRGVPIRLNYPIPFPYAHVSNGPQVSHRHVSTFGSTSSGSESGVDPWSKSAYFPTRGDIDQSMGAPGQGSSVQHSSMVMVSPPRNPSPVSDGQLALESGSPQVSTPMARNQQSNPNRDPNQNNPSFLETPRQEESDDEEEDDHDEDETNENETPIWEDHIQRWLQELAVSTQKRYRNIIKNFIEYLKKHHFAGNIESLRDVNNVTLDHMQQWKRSFGDRRSGTNSNTLIRKHVVCIKSFWKSLFYHWQTTGVVRNAAEGLKIPPKDTRIRRNKYLSIVDVQKFLTEARRKSCTHTCLLGFMYYAGLRVAEVCELKHDDVQFLEEDGLVKMLVKVRGAAAKGCRRREVKCRSEAVEYMRDQLEHLRGLSPNNYYFYGNSLDPVTGERRGNRGIEGVYRIVKKFGKLLKYPKVTPHWFRHAFATHARDRGKPLSAISRDLGHSSLKTTEIYIENPTNAADD